MVICLFYWVIEFCRARVRLIFVILWSFFIFLGEWVGFGIYFVWLRLVAFVGGLE